MIIFRRKRSDENVDISVFYDMMENNDETNINIQNFLVKRFMVYSTVVYRGEGVKSRLNDMSCLQSITPVESNVNSRMDFDITG